MSITSIRARQIFDSRSNPTIEVDLHTARGRFRASAPSGASTGIHEAVELRDGDQFAFGGKGVTKAVHNVNDIIGPALVRSKLKVTQQKEIDRCMMELDGTANKGKLGANAIVAVSMAVSMAGAAEANLPLYAYLASLAGNKPPFVMPCPALNVINGGKHAGNDLAFQEFMILPVGASSFYQAMEMACETYQTLKGVIKEKYGLDATNVGDEGGFAPNVSDADEALTLLVTAIKKAGYDGQVKIGMDLAASEFYSEEEKTYNLDFKNARVDKSQKRKLSGKQLGDLLLDYLKKYPIISIEDPFDQDDWASWTEFTAKASTEVVADDLTVTNPARIKVAIEKKACNALLLKACRRQSINQIGTITESIEAAQLARSSGWGVMVSHRSGETENTFISDLVVGLGVGQIKTGAPARSERVGKYNNMIRIEEEICEGRQKSIYAGVKAFSRGSHPPPLLKN